MVAARCAVPVVLFASSEPRSAPTIEMWASARWAFDCSNRRFSSFSFAFSARVSFVRRT